MFRLYRISVGFKAGKHHPENWEKEHNRHCPCKHGPEHFGECGLIYSYSHFLSLVHQAFADNTQQKDRNDIGQDYRKNTCGTCCTDVV